MGYIVFPKSCFTKRFKTIFKPFITTYLENITSGICSYFHLVDDHVTNQVSRHLQTVWRWVRNIFLFNLAQSDPIIFFDVCVKLLV